MASTAHMHDNHCMYRYLCAGNTVTIFSSHELLLLSWVIWPMDILFLYNLLIYNMSIKILVCYFDLQDLDVFAFQVLNGAGDLLDLLSVIDPASSADWTQMTRSQVLSYVQDRGMCSALIKVSLLRWKNFRNQWSSCLHVLDVKIKKRDLRLKKPEIRKPVVNV